MKAYRYNVDRDVKKITPHHTHNMGSYNFTHDEQVSLLQKFQQNIFSKYFYLLHHHAAVATVTPSGRQPTRRMRMRTSTSCELQTDIVRQRNYISVLSTLFHIMAPTDGYWGKVTSTIDWCEENYVVNRYVAEFCK